MDNYNKTINNFADVNPSFTILNDYKLLKNAYYHYLRTHPWLYRRIQRVYNGWYYNLIGDKLYILTRGGFWFELDSEVEASRGINDKLNRIIEVGKE